MFLYHGCPYIWLAYALLGACRQSVEQQAACGELRLRHAAPLPSGVLPDRSGLQDTGSSHHSSWNATGEHSLHHAVQGRVIVRVRSKIDMEKGNSSLQDGFRLESYLKNMGAGFDARLGGALPKDVCKTSWHCGSSA